MAYVDLLGRVVGRLDHLVTGLIQRVKSELVRRHFSFERLMLLQLALSQKLMLDCRN